MHLADQQHSERGKWVEMRTQRRSNRVQDDFTKWIHQSYPTKTETSETMSRLQRFLLPSQKPEMIDTDRSNEFMKVRQDIQWNHDTSTPRRSETNGVAERAVRRVKEGTAIALLQSGLPEEWWGSAMEC